MDISLGGANGIDLIKSLKAEHEELPVLVVSMHDESLYAERALRAGALGYVMKHEPAKTVKLAIRKALKGEIYLSERMSVVNAVPRRSRQERTERIPHRKPQ